MAIHIDNIDSRLSKRMHSIKYLCVHLGLSLMAVVGNTQPFDDRNSHNIVLVLETQDQDLMKYKCKVKQTQIKDSKFITNLLPNDTEMADLDAEGDSDIEVPLPYEGDFDLIGFNDMCDYFQNVHLYQDYDDYQLPIPLLLAKSNDFYTDVKQLTKQEIVFMKQLESFEDNHNNYDPFDIDTARMVNLFKIGDYLQLKRLITITAARQASLMMNMNKEQMIKWLMDNHNTKKQMVVDNNDHGEDSNDNNAKMVPLLSQTRTTNDGDNTNNEECTINEINDINDIKKYHSRLLMHIMSFFSCYDIHTFSSISNKFYHFVNEIAAIESNIDPMIKILTNNKDATCLLLTNQEVLFYKPFLTLPQHKWSENENYTFEELKIMAMTDNTIDVDDAEYGFRVETLTSFVYYHFYALKCIIKRGVIQVHFDSSYNEYYTRTISFKFGNFAEQLNMWAQSRNIKHIEIVVSGSCLRSFDDLIGIKNINNIKTIEVWDHAFVSIDFEEIYDTSYQLEYLDITMRYKDTTTRSVKNAQFLSKLASLTRLDLGGNNLDSFNFDALKGLTNLQILKVYRNTFSNPSIAQCLDFTFLNYLANLKELDLSSNKIECVIHFVEIKKHLNLESLNLRNNQISSLDLNVFQGTSLKHVDLGGNNLGRLGLVRHTSQVESCLDFNSFNKMSQLQKLNVEYNGFKCIVNFESIQQHRELRQLNLGGNYLLSKMIDFTKFDESTRLLYLHEINFKSMGLKYTMKNNSCLDFQVLKFMPFVENLDFSHNRIECIDNISILQRDNIRLKELKLDNNNLLSFDFADLIGSNVQIIHLTNNSLSFRSVKNFDEDTLSKINPGFLSIHIREGNDKFPDMKTHGVYIH